MQCKRSLIGWGPSSLRAEILGFLDIRRVLEMLSSVVMNEWIIGIINALIHDISSGECLRHVPYHP
jgi:hypothetical protein